MDAPGFDVCAIAHTACGPPDAAPTATLEARIHSSAGGGLKPREPNNVDPNQLSHNRRVRRPPNYSLSSVEWAAPGGRSSRNLGLYEIIELRQRLLPPEIAHLKRNSLRQSFLHDVQLGPAQDFLQGHRRHDLAGQIGIVEPVGIANLLEGHQ